MQRPKVVTEPEVIWSDRNRAAIDTDLTQAMICIFCCTDGIDQTDEHVIPKALGTELIITDVCGPCNSTLGTKVDCALTDHLLMLFQREKYGLAGNSGAVPDMSRELLGRTGTWRLNGQDQKVVVRADKAGIHDVYLTPSVDVDFDLATGAVTVRAQMDERDRAYLRKRIIAAMNKKQVPPEIQQQVLDKLAEPVAGSKQPTINYGISAKDGDTLRRPFAKIAYELAYRWFGPSYLTHPRAVELRRFIMEGVETTDVHILADPKDIARFTQFASPPTEHLALVLGKAQGYEVSVKLFDALVGIVRVTSHADKTFATPYLSAIRFDTTTRTHRELNLIEFAAPFDPGAAMYLQQRAAGDIDESATATEEEPKR